MSSFGQATKYINLVPARQATAAEAAQANIPLTKYYQIRPTRVISKVPVRFVIPAYTENFVAGHLGRLVFQYNYTASSFFYIRQVLGSLISTNLSGVLLIKTISGGIVTRYRLAGLFPTSYAVNYPLYQANIIGSVFSLEFYNTQIPFNGITGIDNNLTIVTSLYSDPISADTQSIDSNIAAPNSLAAMGFNVPVMTPINQPLIYYGTN